VGGVLVETSPEPEAYLLCVLIGFQYQSGWRALPSAAYSCQVLAVCTGYKEGGTTGVGVDGAR